MIAPPHRSKKVHHMADGRRPREVPSIALNVPSAPAQDGNGHRPHNVRHTMGSPDEPDEPYYNLPPKEVRCPVCRVGTLKKRFTACGWFFALALFPVGIICCFVMRERRCNHCKHRPSAEEEPWPE